MLAHIYLSRTIQGLKKLSHIHKFLCSIADIVSNFVLKVSYFSYHCNRRRSGSHCKTRPHIKRLFELFIVLWKKALKQLILPFVLLLTVELCVCALLFITICFPYFFSKHFIIVSTILFSTQIASK